jgi:hypothetical protein
MLVFLRYIGVYIIYETVVFLFIFCALQACISDQPHHMLSKATHAPLNLNE